MLELLKQPWHWTFAGLIIGLTVPALLLLGNKKFGISSSLRHICAACLPANIPFFKYNWKKEIWNLFFVAGIAIGAFLAVNFLQNPNEVQVAEATRQVLSEYGIQDYTRLMPADLFNWDNLFTWKGFVFFIVGGFLGWLRHALCGRVYFRPLHYGTVYLAMAFFGGDDLFYGWRICEHEFADAAYFSMD